MTVQSTNNATSTATMTIEVWSDVVCPWCYIGKRRVEAALHQVGGKDVRIVWRAFQLDAAAPRPGEPGHGRSHAEHLGQKYGGGTEAGQRMIDQMTEVAAGEGLDFHLEKSRPSNTFDAHRVLHLAAELEEQGSPGLQDRVKERFLLGYFTQGLDVADHTVLRDLAVEGGLPADRVQAVLAGTDHAEDVRADQAQAQAYGATGVPFTVVDGRYGVSGAQSAEVFAQAITRARADRVPQMVSPDAVATGGHGECGPDGCALPQP